ncbi:MAG: alanine:cation symporter family protein, partial [Helicobacter sp.]|nr:alanine:cation symporter family protein [Helicobacter sp.]
LSAVVMVFIGSQLNMDLVWNLADITMGIMATINIVAILLLGNIAIKVLKDYKIQMKAGKDPEFKASNIGIKNTECWN